MRYILFLVLPLLVSTGFAQEARIFVFLNSNPDKEKLSEAATNELMKHHLANIEQMVTEGKLLVAGPFDGGGGIFIFNTGDLNLTREWLQTDPAIRANRWYIEMFPIQFSKGGACLAREPYEMITYNFLRLTYINDIANYKMNRNEVSGWQQAVRLDEVIAAGRFPQADGGFIIYIGDSTNWQDHFSADQVSFELKKLWVARGSFCE